MRALQVSNPQSGVTYTDAPLVKRLLGFIKRVLTITLRSSESHRSNREAISALT